jgi:hypothetical protein
MLLTKIQCDGCGRKPNLMEWFRGEISSEGYADWRHPGIVFLECGCPMNYENREKIQAFFFSLFGRALPDELSYLCPQCQEFARAELPALVGSYVPSGDRTIRHTSMG